MTALKTNLRTDTLLIRHLAALLVLGKRATHDEACVNVCECEAESVGVCVRESVWIRHNAVEHLLNSACSCSALIEVTQQKDEQLSLSPSPHTY